MAADHEVSVKAFAEELCSVFHHWSDEKWKSSMASVTVGTFGVVPLRKNVLFFSF